MTVRRRQPCLYIKSASRARFGLFCGRSQYHGANLSHLRSIKQSHGRTHLCLTCTGTLPRLLKSPKVLDPLESIDIVIATQLFCGICTPQYTCSICTFTFKLLLFYIATSTLRKLCCSPCKSLWPTCHSGYFYLSLFLSVSAFPFHLHWS